MASNLAPTWRPRASQKASIKTFNAFGRSPGTKKLPRAAQNPSRTPIWTSRHQFGTPFRCNFNRFSTAFDHPFRHFLCFPASPHEACQSSVVSWVSRSQQLVIPIENTKHKKAIRRPRRVREAETISNIFPHQATPQIYK